MKVFVYGTLRKGYGNHALLYNANFVGKATVKAAMYSMGYIPYVTLQTIEEGDVVHGEVYEIDDNTLARLDRLEGYRPDNVEQSFYERSLVRTSLGEAYIYHIEYDAHHTDRKVKSGDWTQHV